MPSIAGAEFASALLLRSVLETRYTGGLLAESYLSRKTYPTVSTVFLAVAEMAFEMHLQTMRHSVLPPNCSIYSPRFIGKRALLPEGTSVSASSEDLCTTH